jgi:hypothetical protein
MHIRLLASCTSQGDTYFDGIPNFLVIS